MGRRRSSELVVPGTAEQALNVGGPRKKGRLQVQQFQVNE